MSKQVPQKSRLGRGLSSLMNLSQAAAPEAPAAGGEAAPVPTAPASSAPVGIRVLEIAPDQIVPNPHQPRRTFDELALKALADSIRTTGVIQPVVARGTGEGRYELIAG